MKALRWAALKLRTHKRGEEEAALVVDVGWLALRLAGALGLGASIASAAVLATQPSPVHHPTLTLSTKGAAFITRNEGVRYHPYNDPSGIAACTVGVGHVIGWHMCTSAELASTYTPAQVDALLMHDATGAVSCVHSLDHELDQAQTDALVDLIFNAGCGALDYSGIRSLVNGGSLTAVPARLRVTAVTAGGVYLQGLATRRAAEATLWATGYYGAGIGYALPPKPPTAADLLRARTGYWSWLDWFLGEGPWKKYPPRATTVRPHVPARVPAAWWARERAFVTARR